MSKQSAQRRHTAKTEVDHGRSSGFDLCKLTWDEYGLGDGYYFLRRSGVSREEFLQAITDLVVDASGGAVTSWPEANRQRANIIVVDRDITVLA